LGIDRDGIDRSCRVLGDEVDKIDYLIYLLRDIWWRQKSKYQASNGIAGTGTQVLKQLVLKEY